MQEMASHKLGFKSYQSKHQYQDSYFCELDAARFGYDYETEGLHPQTYLKSQLNQDPCSGLISHPHVTKSTKASLLTRKVDLNHNAKNLRFRLGECKQPKIGHMSISRIIREIEASIETEGESWRSPMDSTTTSLPEWSPMPGNQESAGDPTCRFKDSPFHSPKMAFDQEMFPSSVPPTPKRRTSGRGPEVPISLMNSPQPDSLQDEQDLFQSCMQVGTSGTRHEMILTKELQIICQYALEDLTAAQILEFSTRDKYVSLAFQRYLFTVWMKPVPTFTAVIAKNLEKLAVHQFGNYVLQVLSLRDLEVRRIVEEACRNNFLQWLGNEFSSRLLQHLLELSPSFQWFVSTQFSLRFDLCKQDLSSLFVTVALIKCAQDSGMLLFLDSFLKQKIQAALDNRFMRRLIVFYCEKAPQDTLELVFNSMVTLFSEEKILRERTLVSILQGVMSRRHTGALKMLERLVKQRPEQLAKDGFFRFLIKKCFIFPQSIPAISESISRGFSSYMKAKRSGQTDQVFLKEVKVVCKFFGICLNSIHVGTSKSNFKRVFMQAASKQTLQKYITGNQNEDTISRKN